MRYTLALSPQNYLIKKLLIHFADGIPLSCDDLNFIASHEKALSSKTLDPLLKYYLKRNTHNATDDHSFLLPSEKINKEDSKRFKKRLQILLKNTKKSVEIHLHAKQFEEFKRATNAELIFFRGNQYLTGAPFFPGGIPHVVFFQWGNLFGVAKYIILPEERVIHGNVLIHFEDLKQREIKECIKQYIKQEKHAPLHGYFHPNLPYQVTPIPQLNANLKHKPTPKLTSSLR